MPSGLYVLGTTDGGERRNAMTLNWATQVSTDPKWLAVGVERDAYTHQLIEAGRVFSLNLLARDDRALVRKFTKPVAMDLAARTLNGVAYHDGLSGAPILVEAVAYLDCQLRQAVPIDTHTLFIGEVIDAGFLRPEDSDVLRTEDTRMNYGG